MKKKATQKLPKRSAEAAAPYLKWRTHGQKPTTGGPDLESAPGRDPEQDLAPHPDDKAVPKRTVGESNTAEVPSHELGNKNPGHSRG